MIRLAVTLILVSLVGAVNTAQSVKPSFEIASVKPQREALTAATVAGAFPRLLPDGVFRGSHVTVGAMLMFAFDLKQYQIVGGPDWIGTEAFQVEARAGRDVKLDQLKLMVQRLLEDRFRLVAQIEPKVTPFMALVALRADGRLGPYITPVDEKCNPTTAREIRQRFVRNPQSSSGGVIAGDCTGLTRLADTLSLSLETPVIDDTGLKGLFVYELRADVRGGSARGSVMPESVPTLLEALKEQLGLRLDARRGPLQVLVIKSIAHPSPD